MGTHPKAYELYVHGKGQHVISALAAIEKSYADKITDEFVDAFKIGDLEQGLIKDGDAVLCFNFRTDRLRQLTQVLSQEDLPQFGMKKHCISLPWRVTIIHLITYKFCLIKKI